MRASATSGLRASCWTLVASTTVSRPAASRLPATKCSMSKASPVADWSFSSSDTSPRKKSDDRISVGLKCVRANVDLPEPVGPTRTTSDSSGSVDRSSAEHRHLGRRPDLGILGADRQEADRVAEPLGDAVGPGRELGAGPLEAVVAVAEAAGRQRLEADVVLGVGRRDDDVRRAGRTRTPTRSSAGRRPGSRCSMTSISTAASNPARRSSRYVSDAVHQPEPLALALVHPLERAGAARRSPASEPTRRRRRSRSNAWSLTSSLSSRPSPQPRSSTRLAPLARKRRHDRADPLVVQADPLLDRRLLGIAVGLARVRIGGVLLDDELAQRLAGQVRLAREVAAGDQLALGMRRRASPRRACSSFSISAR